MDQKTINFVAARVLASWMDHKSWVPDWQYGGALIYFFLAPKKAKNIFPIDCNAIINTFKTADT